MRLLLTGSGLPWGGQGGRTVGGDENGHTDEREQPLLLQKQFYFRRYWCTGVEGRERK